MDFSEAYRATLPPVHSPDGRHVASVVEYRLIVRDVESLAVVQIYSCLDKIHRVEWSPSGQHILCGLHSRGVAQVWALNDAEWACKIDEGPAGVRAARWSPDGLAVLLVADFCVRMTVWSLQQRSCSHLPGPKHPTRGLAFSPAGNTLAVLERKDCKDWIALYSTGPGWPLRARVQLATLDAAGLAWSPDGARIAIWDSPLAHRVLVHDGTRGECIGSWDGAGEGLGIRTCTWSPGGDVLAVGSYDQVTRVLNSVSWQPLLECHHGSPVDGPPGVAVYTEVEEEQRAVLAPVQQQQATGTAGSPPTRVRPEPRARYIVSALPVDVTQVTPPTDKPNPKLGVSLLAWSPDSTLLASVNENMPHAVWVWDVPAAQLAAVLLHVTAVRALSWSPDECGTTSSSTTQGSPRLAMVCGASRVHTWSRGGASIVHVPLPGFSATALAWAPDGASLTLHDAAQEAFCCAYPTL